MVTVIIYVDDLMIVSRDHDAIEDFASYIQFHFKKVTINRGKRQDYLGMTFDYGVIPQGVKITMPGYIGDLMNEYNIEKSVSTPANNNLF
jgi:hypothetical protein